MKVKMLAALVVGLLYLSVRAEENDAVNKELEKFTGTWKAISSERDGKQLPEDEVNKVQLIVKGKKYQLKTGDQVIEGTHKLDPTKQPKQIDAVRSEGPDAGKTLHGIYELNDEMFRVCFAPPGKDRPTTFATKEGEGQRLLTFKRAKP